MSYRFHELPRWSWTARGGGWVQRLGFFARLYSLVCICLPVEVRASPASLPRGNHMGTVGERREPLQFQSSKAASIPPGYRPHI